MGDEHLAVAIRARTDADGGNVDLTRHARAQSRRDALEYERKRAALLHGHRVAQHLIRPFIGFPLHLEAAERMDALGCEAHVPHHGNLALHHRAYLVFHADAAFELHRLGAALLDEAARVQDGVARADAEGEKRQVGHEQRLGLGAAHRPGVVHHVVQGHLRRVGIAQNHHPQAVADQDDVHVGVVHEFRRGVVVRGDGGDLLPALARPDGGGGDLLAHSLVRAVPVAGIFTVGIQLGEAFCAHGRSLSG